MKKIFTVLVFFLLVFNISEAQTQKGHFMVSGATNFNMLLSNLDPADGNELRDHKKSQKYAHNAGAGYFIIDNLAIVLNGNYTYQYTKQIIYSETLPATSYLSFKEEILNSFTLGSGVIYFFPVDGILKPQIGIGAGYMAMKDRSSNSVRTDFITSHFEGVFLDAKAGVSFFVNKWVSLDLGLEYIRTRLKNKTEDNRDQIYRAYGVKGGISVFF